jgi:tetratricopeptide (TPR) repeat protein
MALMNILSETTLSRCRKNVFAFIALLILTLIVYSNTFDASWHFDDENNILNNTPLHLTELSVPNITQTFFANWSGIEKLYRPVACLTFALNYYVGGTHVYGYHIVNIAIHFLSAVFLFLFIHHTLNLPILIEKYGKNSYVIALLSAVLWAINPVQTQAVTYVVQRMASMAGLFYMMAMYFYLKGRTSAPKALRTIHYFFCVVCGILAIGSKENAVMLPMVILTFDLFFIQGLTNKNIKRYFFLLMIAIGITLSLALLLAGPSLFTPNNLLASYQVRGFTLLERLLTEPRVVLFYISLLLYPMPHRLCMAHDISISKSLLDPPTTLIAVLIIVTLLAMTLLKSRKWPLVSFCILFFFINHAIESTVLPLELIFEHRNYIPSMLFFVPITLLVTKGITFFTYNRLIQFIISAFIVLSIVAIGHSTFIRNFAWKTEATLWLDAVEKSPNLSRPHINLGKAYADVGLRQMALDQYRKALDLPDGPNRKAHYLVHHHMGLIYKSLEDHDRAEKHFLKAVGLEPRFPPAYTQLGILEMEKGEDEKALQYFFKALAHEVNSQQERNYAGLILLRQNKLEDAIDQFQRSLKANPSDQLYLLTHLGAAYNRKGEMANALKCFKKVLNINHSHVPAHLHLIDSYLLKREPANAEETADELIGLFPDDKISLLVDKMIIHGDMLIEPPNMKVVSPIIEKALIKRGNHSYGLAHKLENYRKSKSVP